nr:MAG TPA: hypothetical protein [Caudoviricetes sp.]
MLLLVLILRCKDTATILITQAFCLFFFIFILFQMQQLFVSVLISVSYKNIFCNKIETTYIIYFK